MSESLVNPNNYASLASYDDYGDTNDLNLLSGLKKTSLDRLSGHGHGHGDYGHSTGSYDKKILCDPEGINETLLLLLIGGLIGGGILLLLKIKAAGRSFQDEGFFGSLMSGHLTERILIGLEDFEEKIDNLMGGGMAEENSWISSLYSSFNEVEQSTQGIKEDITSKLNLEKGK